MLHKRILIVDDEAAIRFGVRDFLETQGYTVDEADDCTAAREAFRQRPPDAAILDYSLPDGNALELMGQLRTIDPTVPVVVLTGHGTIDLAVRAIKEGAEQFLTKPVELPALAVILRRLIENQRSRQKDMATRSRESRGLADPFVGTSDAIKSLATDARRVMATESPILIQGETGAGKGVLASWLHHQSPRTEEAFVDLNCAGLSRDLLDTELFGHEKGAFTGATAAKVGLFEVAHRGTVFLDEIGDVDLQVQPKLLKVLEEKKFRRLGDVRDRRVDVRLIAATHRDLAQLVRENKFRSDLYFRINTIPLSVPALRQRPEDIPVLAARLLAELAGRLGRGEVVLAADAVTALRAYPWPGNIRELRNVLERAVLLSDKNVLGRTELRFDPVSSLAPGAAPPPADLTLKELEQRHIERVLQEEAGRVDRASARLGIPRSSLYERIKRYGIPLGRA